MLSEDSIKELQQIFREEYGEDLPLSEVEAIGTRLMLLWERLYEPLPGELDGTLKLPPEFGHPELPAAEQGKPTVSTDQPQLPFAGGPSPGAP